ncbi:exodeoxyribonuclease III [Paracoccus sediminis]|uniref:Exodeoxyribonuclease III n=1 Tax=Paracoccus sediminis TaxID=1214787 RepID=A0ABY1YF21_9RHOB|nr:exodeoxyribonuclease III [Paracoccus sediminis]TBN46963.1 exodeoxyribonuclease III [Paracoccus sediminis]
MRIATYNINGTNGRLETLLAWLDDTQSDIVCLQDLKAPQAKFPERQLKEAGYAYVWHGQSRWNGVAILSRGSEPVLTRRGLPRDPDPSQCRYIEAAVNGVLVGCLYVPNGNPAPGPKWDYKLEWLKQFTVHAKQLLALDVPVILAGDYNIIPAEHDVYNPDRWQDDALFLPQHVRKAYASLLKQGWCGATATIHTDKPVYPFWDYLRQARERSAGLRLDHLLLSHHLTARLKDAGVDRDMRGRSKASDHAPAWIDLARE